MAVGDQLAHPELVSRSERLPVARRGAFWVARILGGADFTEEPQDSGFVTTTSKFTRTIESVSGQIQRRAGMTGAQVSVAQVYLQARQPSPAPIIGRSALQEWQALVDTTGESVC